MELQSIVQRKLSYFALVKIELLNEPFRFQIRLSTERKRLHYWTKLFLFSFL